MTGRQVAVAHIAAAGVGAGIGIVLWRAFDLGGIPLVPAVVLLLAAGAVCDLMTERRRGRW